MQVFHSLIHHAPYTEIMEYTNTSGFPSPAQGYEKDPVDFNKILIRHPAATFVMRYAGKPHPEYSIAPGDLLVVDSAAIPVQGKPAVLQKDGEFVCGQVGDECDILFGIITSVVHIL